MLLHALVLLAGFAAQGLDADPDRDTIALWLFDEIPYPNVTLTDAGPLRADLRLRSAKQALPAEMRDGKSGLLPGRHGNALVGPLPDGVAVVWPENYTWRDGGTSFASERGNEVPERLNLGYLDWTLEFWMRGDRPQAGRATIWELRNETGAALAPPGTNALCIDAGRERFVLLSRIKHHAPKVDWNVELEIPTQAALLNDGAWHHVAFTFTAAERQLRHYVDGKRCPLPEKGGFLPLIGQLRSLTLAQAFAGAIDELRISSRVRYATDFAPPGSFSRVTALPDAAIVVPPLFVGSPSEKPLPLGDRKHVFIDAALLEKQEGVAFAVQPPSVREATDFRNQFPWEPTPRYGAAIPDVCSVWDEGDHVSMLYTNGGMWGGKSHAVCYAESPDGLHWTKPELNLQSWDGSTRNNIVLRLACQGSVIKDPRPGVADPERYKFLAWCMNRGFFVFTSADGKRWRRNETLALPFDPDGSTEVFWDDQAGLYRGYFRALGAGHPENRDYRSVVRAEVRDILKPWPFKPSPAPQWHVFESPKPSGGEFPIIECGGEVYRMKAIKYAWAPDVFLAFPWRYKLDKNIRPGSFIMVSRDGERWTRYESPYYFGSGWTLDGRTVLEALVEQGMIRRGDQLWQFGTVRFTEHAGALYGGVEHEGGIHDRFLRLTQRLDGFVALQAGPEGGSAWTRPLTFKGNRLRINFQAKGSVRVALLDDAGKPIPGYDLADCRPASGDSVSEDVHWAAGPDLGALQGKPLRVRIELRDARLFALQFSGHD
ncbi:MAG TPA: LamG domain-containing protein [Planctomycetota bacterium]|nr:LamG domain-containing protein [Planctomycetota bacterium]